MMIFKGLMVSLLIVSQVLQGNLMAEEQKTYDMNTNPSLIDIYLNALKMKESTGRYEVLHSPSMITDSQTGKPIRVQALGAYGILDINFPVWAEQAGLGDFSMADADWKDPKAQDAIAKFKVQQYFNRFGSWDLVSVAWFAGFNKAKELEKNGTIDFDKKDVKGTSIGDYIAGMNKLLGEELMNIEVDMQPIEITPPEPDTPIPIDTMSRSAGITNQFGTPPNDNERYAAQILDALTRSNAGGERPRMNTGR